VSVMSFRRKKVQSNTDFTSTQKALRQNDINPFDTSTPWTLSELLLIIPMTPVVFVRLLLLGVSFAVSSGMLVLAVLVPETSRRWFLRPVQWCARLVLCAFGYWTIQEEGYEENGRVSVGIVCAAPHMSLLDVFYFAYRWLPCFVAKKDVRDMPVIGFLAVGLHAIFIDRNADAKAKAGYKDQIRLFASDPKLPPLLLFPEGTCTNGEALITFKRGSFEPGVDILPVCMKYGGKLNPAAVGRNSGILFLLRVLYQWSNTLSVQVLPLYSPSEEEKKDPILFAANVQELMGKHSGIPSTRHSLADMWFYQKIVDDELPEDVFQFVFAELYEYFDLRDRAERNEFRQILSLLLGRWSEVDQNSDGAIEQDEFSVYARSAGISQKMAELLFVQFDVQRNSKLDFLELAAACFALQRLSKHVVYENPEGISEREVQDAFRFYRGGDSEVHRDSVVLLLREGCGLEFPDEILSRYFSQADGSMELEDFGEFYRENKSYLKLPFALGGLVLSILLTVPKEND